MRSVFKLSTYPKLTRVVSQRGVVFFRKQDDFDNELQKELAQRLGELSGKPETSKLHIHPVSNSGRRLGGNDDEISVISSEQAKELYKNRFLNFNKKQSSKEVSLPILQGRTYSRVALAY